MLHTLVRSYSVCSPGGGGAISSLHRTISGSGKETAFPWALAGLGAKLRCRGEDCLGQLPLLTNLPLTILRRQQLLPPILPPGLLQLDLTQQETSIGQPTADQILSLKILALRPPESI